jgi:type IV secretion system protein VirB10
MSIWDKNQSSGRAGASADQVASGKENTEIPSALEHERGIPPVSRKSYQSRGTLIALAAGVVALIAMMWVINRPASEEAKRDPYAANQRFDETKVGDGQIAPPVPKAPPVIDLKPFEPPKPPTPLIEKPVPVVPKIEGQLGAPKVAQARPKTPMEMRMASSTVIRNSMDPAALRQAMPGQAGQQMAAGGLPGLMPDGSQASPGTGLPVFAPGSPEAQDYAARAAQQALQNAMASAQGGGRSPPSFSPGAPLVIGPGQAPQGGRPGSPDSSGAADENSVGSMMRPTKLEGARAIKLADRRLMLAAGKLIDCSLDTAISTIVAGMVKCTLTRDVYGEDGSIVVMDRGTEMIGEYRSSMKVGQTRLGVIWTRAKTPTGVLIELMSPASDPLGRGGIDGFVDTRFWDRYGAALMLSVLDDALGIVASRARDTGFYYPPNTSRTGREAASVALEQNIRIPPTLVKNQGEHVTVFVARDLDFRSVYRSNLPVKF